LICPPLSQKVGDQLTACPVATALLLVYYYLFIYFCFPDFGRCGGEK
jgi:hypothetical protein